MNNVEVMKQEPVAICPNCLGTKRPHADDLDWRGRCDCTPPAAQPAPDVADIIAGELNVSRGAAYDMMRKALEAAQPAVPLTREQREEVCVKAERAMRADPNLSWRNALITQTEAAHGITAQKGGEA